MNHTGREREFKWCLISWSLFEFLEVISTARLNRI